MEYGDLPCGIDVAPLFTAQAIARRMIADGRENEVQEIREFISTIVPDPDANSHAENTSAAQIHSTEKNPR